jgi:3-methyl-2-oxobutanoate hydroxymethyltransferase
MTPRFAETISRRQMDGKVTVPALQQMKHDGKKIVGVVTYDFQMAQVVDRAGVDIVSVGDSVGVMVWGHRSEMEVTVDQMVLVCQAVRRGVTRALVSCDVPFGPLQEGTDAAVRAAIRLVKDGGADLIKLDGASLFPDAVRAITRAGLPVWAQFGITPHTAFRYGGMTASASELAASRKDQLRDEAKALEDAGAALLDFTHSGPVAGPEAVRAVKIPVIGGLGGGPWLDGRVRGLFAAIGYTAAALDDGVDRYANVAEITLSAIKAFSDDVRGGRQIRGAPPSAPRS